MQIRFLVLDQVLFYIVHKKSLLWLYRAKDIRPFNVPSISYIERLFNYFQKENVFK